MFIGQPVRGPFTQRFHPVSRPKSVDSKNNMELYATGNNAWNQLDFDGVADASTEPTDFTSFQLVLEDAVIDRPHASLACTLGMPPESRTGKHAVPSC